MTEFQSEQKQGLLQEQSAQTLAKNKRLYTKGEEIFNAVTHLFGGAVGIAFLVVGIVYAVLYNDGYAVASMTIYGISIVVLYSMSAVYHILKPGRAKRFFRVLDHCTIFALIAGTYTPFCLIALRQYGAWGWSIFCILWGLAAVGILLNGVNMHNKTVKRLSMVAYLAMGWCAVIAIVPLTDAISVAGFMWTLAGGVAYTVGAVFYGFGRKIKYSHSVWHLFVVAGTAIQFFGILFYVVM